jgi:hypothetical protein
VLQFLGVAPGVQAQTAATSRTPARRETLEVSGGGGWVGGVGPEARDGALPVTASGGQPYRLFSTRTDIGGAPAVTGRVGWQATRGLALEMRLGVSRPVLRTIVSSDIENGAGAEVTERLTQYDIDGGVRAFLPGVRVGTARPFVTAGMGVARRVHDGRALIEIDRTFYIGGGMRYAWRAFGRGAIKSSGVRVDARLDVLDKTPVSDGSATRAAIDANIFIAF